MRKVKSRKKNKLNVIVSFIIMIVCVTTLCFSIKNIFNWKKDSINTDKVTKKIDDVVEVLDVDDNEKTEIIEQEEIPEFNPYWDYIKMNLIHVNFNELKEINDDTKGWIKVNGTNVNYPFVQASNNDYYLNHSFDKSYNDAGWVFLDYRNKIGDMDKNTIIYAHGRFDNTMFGTLRNILSNGWTKNSDNFVIRMSSEYENTLWQVFSVYKIPTTSDYLQIYFDDDSDFLDFSKMLLDRSGYNFNTSISSNDKILTLSTCYNDDIKLVVHAKLIKKEDRN